MSASIQHLGPESGVLHSASTQIASTLKSSGKYLEEHGISGIAGELTAVIRKNPVPAIFAALGVGFLVARVTKRD
ncbi:MAG TPA: hypothetical protein VFE24_10970 [Pirellulales bacterium]|nr:hypothetical protein [Pirellulales bacterium]